MIALIQRVSQAEVIIDGQSMANIQHGLLALIGIQKQDNLEASQQLARKITSIRVFEDLDGKMNWNVKQSEGDVLIVPQFTLAANNDKGHRPSFSQAMAPKDANVIYSHFHQYLKQFVKVESGVFGATMQVCLVNDGPATFWIEV